MDGSIEDVEHLLVKLAVIAEQLDVRGRGALQRIDTSTTTLERSAQCWMQTADEFSRQIMATLAAQAHDSMADMTHQALVPLQAQLRQGTEAARWAAEALAEQRRLLTRAQQSLVHRSLLALLAASVLAVAGSGYLAWCNLHQAALGEDVQQAVRSGALVRCPDNASLCVRIGRQPRRSGERGEYLVVQP